MATVNVLRQVTVNGGAVVGASKTYEKGAIKHIDEEAFIASTADQLFNLAVDVSQMSVVQLLATQDVTVETNDGTTPQDTINLKANVPLIWTEDDPAASNPFSGDVTALYVTESGGNAGKLSVVVLEDPTP